MTTMMMKRVREWTQLCSLKQCSLYHWTLFCNWDYIAVSTPISFYYETVHLSWVIFSTIL